MSFRIAFFCPCSVVNSGAYRIVNGTCAHEDTTETTLAQLNMCPDLREIAIKCTFTAASATTATVILVLCGILAVLLALNRDRV